MKREPGFWREDHVREVLKTLGKKLTIKAGELAIDNMEKEFDEVALLLVHLYLDLKLSPYIEKNYILEMKNGYAKETALSAFKIAKELVEESN